MKTFQEYKDLILSDVSYIENVPKEFLNQELYDAVFESNMRWGMQYIPKEYVTQNMVDKIASDGDTDLLIYIPSELLSQEFFTTLIATDPYDVKTLIEFTPNRYKTKEYYNDLITKARGLHYKELIPEDVITYDNCFESIKKFPNTFKDIPVTGLYFGTKYNPFSDYNTEKLIDYLIDNFDRVTYHGSILEYVLSVFKTEERCKRVINKFPSDIKYVPTNESWSFNFVKNFVSNYNINQLLYVINQINFKGFKDEEIIELCDIIFNNNIKHFEDIPVEYRTEKMSKIYIEDKAKKYPDYHKPKMQYVPENFRTKQLYTTWVKVDFSNVKDVPKEFLNKKIADYILSLSNWTISYIPNKYYTKEICYDIINKDASLFEYIPKKFKTEELCLLAYRKDKTNIRSFPKQYQTKELWLEAINEKTYYRCIRDVPEEYLSFDFLYNLLKKLELSDTNKDIDDEDSIDNTIKERVVSEIMRKFLRIACKRKNNITNEQYDLFIRLGVKIHHKVIDVFTDEFIKDNYNELIDSNINSFKYIVKRLSLLDITRELCEKVLSIKGTLFTAIPKELRDYSLYKLACQTLHNNKDEFENYYFIQEFVDNKEYQTKEVIDLLFSKDKEFIQYIPVDKVTIEMAFEAINFKHELIEFIPKHLINYELAYNVLSKNIFNIEFIPSTLSCYEELCRLVLNIHGNCIQFIDKKTPNYFDLCKLAVTTTKISIKFIDKNIQNYEQLLSL